MVCKYLNSHSPRYSPHHRHCRHIFGSALVHILRDVSDWRRPTLLCCQKISYRGRVSRSSRGRRFCVERPENKVCATRLGDFLICLRMSSRNLADTRNLGSDILTPLEKFLFTAYQMMVRHHFISPVYALNLQIPVKQHPL